MVIEHIFPDLYRLNRAKQYPRRPQNVSLRAQVHDLAYRGITQQVIGNLDCDFHCGLGGAFVAFGLVFALTIRAASIAIYFFNTDGSGTADVAYLMGRFNIANRPLDVFVPDFLALALVEPPHRHAFEIPASIVGRGTICGPVCFMNTGPIPPAISFRERKYSEDRAPASTPACRRIDPSR